MSLYNGHTHTQLITYYEKMKSAQKKGIAYSKSLAYASQAGSTAWLKLELKKKGLLVKMTSKLSQKLIKGRYIAKHHVFYFLFRIIS